ncbi:MAG TPA: hypothetical protein VF616_26640 [Duganella sp.]|uniref:hypothetical protein n=1 Tax=Duganella sp. TaxID=1904440 RepID=UPI002ED685E5
MEPDVPDGLAAASAPENGRDEEVVLDGAQGHRLVGRDGQSFFDRDLTDSDLISLP